jgi:hypothetical protein
MTVITLPPHHDIARQPRKLITTRSRQVRVLLRPQRESQAQRGVGAWVHGYMFASPRISDPTVCAGSGCRRPRFMSLARPAVDPLAGWAERAL